MQIGENQKQLSSTLVYKFRTLWTIRREFTSFLKQMESLLAANLNFGKAEAQAGPKNDRNQMHAYHQDILLFIALPCGFVILNQLSLWQGMRLLVGPDQGPNSSATSRIWFFLQSSILKHSRKKF
jgi:hypothetical protein